MLHEFRIRIIKSPDEVFQFLCHKDSHKQEKDSPVLLLEKTTGLIGIGTCFREVVQMAPFLKSQILSEVTRYEPNSVLEEKWAGDGMKGVLTYSFHPSGKDTDLVQIVDIETICSAGNICPLSCWRPRKARPKHPVGGIQLLMYLFYALRVDGSCKSSTQ